MMKNMGYKNKSFYVCKFELNVKYIKFSIYIIASITLNDFYVYTII